MYPSAAGRVLPQRPVRLRFHLRVGLVPDAWPGVIIQDGGGPHRVHAYILDAAAEPAVLDRALRDAAARVVNDEAGEHPPLFLCGTVPDPILNRLASVAHAIAGGDPTRDDGLHFVTQLAVPKARIFARRDPVSRVEWAQSEIGPWISTDPYRDAGLTVQEALVMALHVLGFDRAEVAAVLHVTENTVKTHIRRVLQRTGHTEMGPAIRPLQRALGPVAPHEFLSPHDGMTTTPRIILDSVRTPPGGRRI